MDQARQAAKRIAADAAFGINPDTVRKQKAEKALASITVAKLWTAYREQHLVPKCSESTLRTDDSRYGLHLAAWALKPIDEISRTAVAEFHRQLTVSDSSSVADKTLKLLRRMLSWAKVSPNPVADGAIEFHGDDHRERFLSQDELSRLAVALNNAPNTTIADAIRFALLTGARKGNVCGARWADIHLDRGLWVIPKDQSKNKKPMTIVLAPDAIELLKLRRQLAAAGESPYVFPGRRLDKPIGELKTTWDKIRKAAKIDNCRIHDLRHTLASWMAMNGASLLMIGQQLGHASKQSTARYSHLEVGATRQATEAAIRSMFSPASDSPGGSPGSTAGNRGRKNAPASAALPAAFEHRSYFTPAELANLLNTSVEALGQWRRDGSGPAFVKAGRFIQYPRPGVEQWARSERRTLGRGGSRA